MQKAYSRETLQRELMSWTGEKNSLLKNVKNVILTKQKWWERDKLQLLHEA